MSKVIKSVAIILMAVSFLGGVCAGFLFMIEPQLSYKDPYFNWMLMLVIWLGGFFWAMLMLGFAELLRHSEQTAIHTARIAEALSPTPTHQPVAPKRSLEEKFKDFKL